MPTIVKRYLDLREEKEAKRERPATAREASRLIGLGLVYNPQIENYYRPQVRESVDEGVTVTAPRLTKRERENRQIGRMLTDIAAEGPIRLPRISLPSSEQVANVVRPINSLAAALNPITTATPLADQGREIIKEMTGVPHMLRTNQRGAEALRRGDPAAEIGHELVGAGGNVALLAAPEVALLGRSMVAPRALRAAKEITPPPRVAGQAPRRTRDLRSEIGSDVYDSMSAAERESLREGRQRSAGYFSGQARNQSPSGGYEGVRFGERITNRVNPRGRPRNASGTASEYAEKSFGRLLTEAEKLARESRGGRLPSGYTETLAQRTGYTPESVKHRLMEIRNGDYGPALRSRARAIGLAKSGRSNWQRAEIARMMDQGLDASAINARLNAVREARNMGPADISATRVIMSQVRKRRRDTGDPSAIGLTIASGLGASGLSASEARAQVVSEYDSAVDEVRRLEAGVRMIDDTDANDPESITRMQTFLKKAGLYTQNYTPDGEWGRGTDTAVENYRKRLETARANLTRLNKEREEASRRTRATPGELAFREIAPNAAFWGGLALGIGSRGATTFFTNRATKRAVREANALLPSGNARPLARNQTAAARRRMGRLTDFYAKGGESELIPFVESPRSRTGFKPNPAGIRSPTTLFPRETGGGALGTIKREYHIPDLFVMGGAGVDVGVTQTMLMGAEQELNEARERLKRDPNSEAAMSDVRSALNQIAWLKMFRAAGGGLGLGHAGAALKLRYSRERPDVGRANAELAELMAFLAPKKSKPTRTPKT